MDGVVISNIRMQRVRTPIFVRLGARRAAESKPSSLRGVMIDNVHATGAILTSSITGIPGSYVEDVSLSHVHVESGEAGKQAWADRKVPEQIPAYPEARMFGRLPAYGFYCRHVKGLKMDHVDLTCSQPEERPAMHFEDVKGLHLDQLSADAPAAEEPMLRLVDVQDALVTHCTTPLHSQQAIELRGAETQRVRLIGNDFSGSRNAVVLRDGAKDSAVSQAGNLMS